jgi:hypothetical protein
MTTIFRASVGSKHFDFEGYGHTAEEAFDALRGAIRAHGQHYPVADDWEEEAMRNAQENGIGEILIGAGYRDRSVIAPPRPA